MLVALFPSILFTPGYVDQEICASVPLETYRQQPFSCDDWAIDIHVFDQPPELSMMTVNPSRAYSSIICIAD